MMMNEREILSQIQALNIDQVEEFNDFRAEYETLMMEYRCAIMEVETKLNVLNSEFAMSHNRNPIQTIKSRLKQPKSLLAKLKRKHLNVTMKDIEENISDIAGVRIICSFPEDIYAIADLLLHQDDIRMIEIKDYIKHPKESGYRSLHLIVEVPIFLSTGKKMRKVEIQCRTIAMDFWASVEHQLKYNKNLKNTEQITRELKECADIITSVDFRMQELRGKIAYVEPKTEPAVKEEKKDERILKTYEDDGMVMGSSHDYLRNLAGT
ncbi:MAG: GTP pyrophosphokinase family protein [Lachnospiraceae bacterium]|nr:GTP pyrophosphokinase family protein [Lachnospiraceae bacterium]MCI1328515.1 GTP pyrophosphokinase family protein [Lachnospiraceae bacterium]